MTYILNNARQCNSITISISIQLHLYKKLYRQKYQAKRNQRMKHCITLALFFHTATSEFVFHIKSLFLLQRGSEKASTQIAQILFFIESLSDSKHMLLFITQYLGRCRIN